MLNSKSVFLTQREERREKERIRKQLGLRCTIVFMCNSILMSEQMFMWVITMLSQNLFRTIQMTPVP